MDYDYYGSGNGGGALAAVLAIYAITFGIAICFAAVFYVVMALALSSFFRKVGVEPWIAWVPYYNTWKWLEVGGQKGWLSLLSLIPYGNVATSVFLYIGMWRSGIAFRKDAGFLVLGIFLPFVWAFLLGRAEEEYHPELITQAGFPPPLAGYGSAAHAAGQAASGTAPTA
jgi:hypothetical protein